MKLSLYLILTFIHLSRLIPALPAQVTFPGTELLSRPTDHSVTVNVVADADLQAFFEYGITSGTYTNQTVVISSSANDPIVAIMDDLLPNTRYYYRMCYSTDNGSTWEYRGEHTFHTQRQAGSTFSFAVTSDSHVNITLGNPTIWTQTLNQVANENTDLLIDLGDTFAMDYVASESGARNAYIYQRSSSFFGLVSHSASIFIAPGNHEQEEGWHLDDNGNPINSLPVWGTNARKRYFPNPVPDDFYTGNTETYYALSGDQLQENYYAWTWGDALFVVIDPFWYTTTKPFTGNIGGGYSYSISPNAPIGIDLISCHAQRTERDRVLIEWKTAAEINTCGYFLQRRDNDAHGFARIHERIISAQGNSVSGAAYQFIDANCPRQDCCYRLESLNLDGQSTLSEPIKVSSASSIEKEESMPLTFILQQNYPNPFNSMTHITYTIPSNSPVSLNI